MATHRTPESVHEYLRLAHAFLAGSRFPEGSTVYVVASNVPPLYRVQGVYAQAADADAAADGGVDSSAGWTRAEQESRFVYTITVPHLHFENRVFPIIHPSWTEIACAASDPPIRTESDRPRFDQIESMELRIVWGGGRRTTFALPADSDSVFITRGAAEMFLYPHYAAVFGHEYVENRRRSLLAQAGTAPRPPR